MERWNALMEERGSQPDTPMKPQVVAWELGKRLAEDAVFTCDSGTIATWYARQIPVRRNQQCTLSGNLATMANGFPYAIAAQVAWPQRQCVAFVGDGGFAMLMGELATCVKHKLPVKVIIIKNNTPGQIKWEQMVFLGNPEFGCELEPIDFAAFARACGAKGYTIENPKECGSIFDQALAEPGPVVVEALVDPHEPPMPPKVSLEQSRKFAESLRRGTPNRDKIALTVLSDKVRELI
jgi:pyruvate dehydrogenase (quinone)/pyruvate oxidase